MAHIDLVATRIVFNIRVSSSHIGLMVAFSDHRGWIISAQCLIEDQSWIYCIDITSRWDTFVLFHLYGNKGVSSPLWPIRPRWFHTFCPCAEPLRDGHEGMWARFGSQASIALNWHSHYSGMRYSGTWLYCCNNLLIRKQNFDRYLKKFGYIDPCLSKKQNKTKQKTCW